MDKKVENVPQVTLGEAKKIVSALAATQSVLLLSPPGVGKSAVIRQAADEAGLECRSLLGTQIAPEDVSGIPRIVGERSVFCPPRVLLPEDPAAKPFCLFLDELPACTPDIQKAFYSLLLERRVGEYPLPKGTWVVAAGNRAEDRSLVRSLSAALVNRVTILNVKVSVPEWLNWAHGADIRHDVISYIIYAPHSLQRSVPSTPSPFSTPRAWESLSKALDCLDRAGALTHAARKARAFGTVAPVDAAAFCVMCEHDLDSLHPWYEYIRHPELVSQETGSTSLAKKFFILDTIRRAISAKLFAKLDSDKKPTADEVNAFLNSLRKEDRIVLLLDHVQQWAELGADNALVNTFDDLIRTFP